MPVQLWGLLGEMFSTAQQTRRVAYLALVLVRSSLEYMACVWDPYTTADIEKLEKVQRRTACFISKDYKSRQGVTKMLEEHHLPPLLVQQRRKEKIGPFL